MKLTEKYSNWVVLIGFAVIALGCQPANKFAPPPPPDVTVAQPLTRDVTDSIEFVGRTAASATVELRARVNGYLEKILFEDGANVTQGQLLFLIRQAPYQIALDAAKAELDGAKAARDLAESELRRIQPLVDDGAMTQAEFDTHAAQVKTSEAKVALAETTMRRAEIDLGYTEVRAPIAGRIGRHLLDAGNLVQAEQTQLAIIQSIDPIYVYFDLSEADLLKFMSMLRKRELPDPDLDPPMLQLGLANESGFPHSGRLDFRELGVDPSTGTTLRRGIFPNADHQLVPGLFARVYASIGNPSPRFLIDDRAIGTDQRGDFVLIVNDKDIVEYRPVKLGIHDGPLRVIEEGISPSDWLIVNGLQRARPGVKVNPLRPTEPDGLSESDRGAKSEKPTAEIPAQIDPKPVSADAAREQSSSNVRKD